MFTTRVRIMPPTPASSPASPLCGTAISSGRASRTTSVTNTERNAILRIDFSSSTRFFLEKMFFRFSITFSFLAEGLSFSNASTTPTCRNSENIPTISTISTKGSTSATASRSAASSAVGSACSNGMPTSVAGIRIRRPRDSTMPWALPSM
ncbi:hypothetical protein D3C85_449250 [compost metagenome]